MCEKPNFQQYAHAVALTLLLAGNAYCQFWDLASADDGSIIYFATNMRLQAEPPPDYPQAAAIFRVTTSSGTVERFTTGPLLNFRFPDSHGNPAVSGNGTVVSYTETHVCIGGSACLDHPNSSYSFLFVEGQPYANVGGAAQISRNGRYILNFGSWSSPFGGSAFYDDLRNVETSIITHPPVWPSSRRQAVTSEGSVLGFDLQSRTLLQLWNGTTTRAIATSEPAQDAIINDAGTHVVYQSYQFTGGSTTIRLRALDLKNGHDVVLNSRVGYPFGHFVSISNDGTTVLYVAEPESGQALQAWLIHPDGSGRTQLTKFPEGVDEAVLDGNGDAAFAVTGGRLVRVDTQTGAMTDIISRTVTCSPGFQALTPGSILPIRGSYLANSTEDAPIPLPMTLGGVRVLMDRTPLPILRISPTEVWFQVPFELVPTALVSVGLEHSTVFEACPPARVPVSSRWPYFFSSSSGYLTLAHEDFGSSVTAQSPARRGEIVHAFGVGLGYVTPQMKTGVPTPLDRLFRLAEPFTCTERYAGDVQSVDVPFAGLAPGMIGIYQVDIRIPAELPAQQILIVCGTPGSTTEIHGGIVPVEP